MSGINIHEWAHVPEFYVTGVAAVAAAAGDNMRYYFYTVEYQKGEPQQIPVLKIVVPRSVLRDTVQKTLQVIADIPSEGLRH